MEEDDPHRTATVGFPLFSLSKSFFINLEYWTAQSTIFDCSMHFVDRLASIGHSLILTEALNREIED